MCKLNLTTAMLCSPMSEEDDILAKRHVTNKGRSNLTE